MTTTKKILKFFTFFTFSLAFLSANAQSVANALKSGLMIRATFTSDYVNVFKSGEPYDVKVSGNYWYGKGYHAKRKAIVVNENYYEISSGEPGPRDEGDAGSFSIYGAGFAFNHQGQFYQAGVPDKILGTVSIPKPEAKGQLIRYEKFLGDLPNYPEIDGLRYRTVNPDVYIWVKYPRQPGNYAQQVCEECVNRALKYTSASVIVSAFASGGVSASAAGATFSTTLTECLEKKLSNSLSSCGVLVKKSKGDWHSIDDLPDNIINEGKRILYDVENFFGW